MMEVLLVARVLLLRSMAGIFKQLPTHTTHMMYMTQTHNRILEVILRRHCSAIVPSHALAIAVRMGK